MLKHLAPEELEEIAQLAREAHEAQDEADDADAELEDEPGLADALEVDALRDRIEALSSDARAELLAAFYVGRGDFAADEWDEALKEAQAAEELGRAEPQLETATLHEVLEKALFELELADDV